MIVRPRRLRSGEIVRGMVRETRASRDSLIYPIFFEEGKNIKTPIDAMDGQFRYSLDRAKEIIDQCLSHGVNKVLLFGIPKEKDEKGSQAYAENGIVQQAVRAIKEEYGDSVYVVTDVCMCEYTSHGHCGILCGHDVDNDETLKYLTATAVSHAEAGADMVAPSDMMDGRVAAIREGLDRKGFKNVPIMSYAVKYASKFYGPFREAAGSAPSFGDRKTYQMDPHNVREAMREAKYDEPVATYSVSGEYSMIKNAGKAGLIDEYGIMCETTASMFRAGADIVITYYAMEAADAIVKGDIG